MDKIDFFIGPCVLETRDLAFTVAEFLKKELIDFESKINLSFKGSYDKANRSSIDSYRGPGIDAGLKILEEVKKEFGFNTITDYHSPAEADIVAKVVDTIQVPAFLCRQTDMIIAGAKACSENNARLKVKKGQFLSPADTKNIVDKAKNFLKLDDILLTERGTSFGYNNLVVDMGSFQVMKSFGVKTIHDCTHCVQMPGGLGGTTGGKRELIIPLARAAAAAGADGFFMEAHPNPAKALSDSTNQLPLTEIKRLVSDLVNIKELLHGK
jgi:2-dehydro-3-deoxyphosphooctonate aldolase (KDO 8-P synthase)